MLWFPPRSPLHSHPERHFHVLPSPDLHLIIIGTDVFKVGLGDGEEATSERRGSGETEGEYVYLLGKRGVGTYVWKAVDSLRTPTTDPTAFPGCAAPLPLTYSFSKCLLSYYYYVLFTSGNQAKDGYNYHYSLLKSTHLSIQPRMY